MDEVQKPSNSGYYTPLSEPFGHNKGLVTADLDIALSSHGDSRSYHNGNHVSHMI
jgi:hypothetical protein